MPVAIRNIAAKGGAVPCTAETDSHVGFASSE